MDNTHSLKCFQKLQKHRKHQSKSQKHVAEESDKTYQYSRNASKIILHLQRTVIQQVEAAECTHILWQVASCDNNILTNMMYSPLT